ncbi:MAG: hypothetical protein QNK25_01910 [Desulfobacterales bacterium]|nr:hypothetical protein [Desulfobacterales bacterium]
MQRPLPEAFQYIADRISTGAKMGKSTTLLAITNICHFVKP